VIFSAVTACGLVDVYQCSGKKEGQFFTILLYFSYQPQPSFHHSAPALDNHIPCYCVYITWHCFTKMTSNGQWR